MKFAHLVEINDPLNPLIDPLTRAQLWRGLVLRASTPNEFVPWLDRCEVVQEADGSLARVSHYGELAVRDRVSFEPQQRVVYQVPPQKDIPASHLSMTIEEPQPGILFVRFEYDSGGADDDGAEAFYNDFRRSAYVEADVDTIRIIRQKAELGLLDGDSTH
jgi:hypothetical protein